MAPPVVTLPQVVIAEFSPFRRWTASGLFSYRQAQAIQLIQLPDLGPGDLSPDERREALNQMVSLHRPLAAIAIAMGVVALEDFIRDICARLAGTQFLHLHFPRIRGLETVLLSPNQNRPFARLDKDPIVGFTEPGGTNDLFVKCIGLGPFEPVDFDRLRDLALIRHTVVHHAAVIRGIDAPRFQYYIVQAEQLINPPPTFVNETLLYLHQLGLKFEKAIAAHIFSRVLPTLGPGWAKRRPQELIELIELFDYFGKLVLDGTQPPLGSYPSDPTYEEWKAKESERIKEDLLIKCLDDLCTQYVHLSPG